MSKQYIYHKEGHRVVEKGNPVGRADYWNIDTEAEQNAIEDYYTSRASYPVNGAVSWKDKDAKELDKDFELKPCCCSNCDHSCEIYGTLIAYPLPQEGEGVEGRCQKCGKENVCWYADNELFNKVNGSPNGIICPQCFENMADEKQVNIIFHATQVTQEGEEELWSLYVGDLQAGLDRDLRDKGASSKEVYDAVIWVTNNLKDKYNAPKSKNV